MQEEEEEEELVNLGGVGGGVEEVEKKTEIPSFGHPAAYKYIKDVTHILFKKKKPKTSVVMYVGRSERLSMTCQQYQFVPGTNMPRSLTPLCHSRRKTREVKKNIYLIC